MKPKILVVEDDKTILRLIKRYLEEQGFAVITTDHGSEALLLAQESRPHLILTDVQVPGLDGNELCRVAKQETGGKIPIILMSGTDVDEKKILKGYEGGADEYILKPFSMPVLLAKIQAVLKRYEPEQETQAALKDGGLEIDAEGRTVKVNGKAVALTRKEFDLLSTLVSRPNRVLTVRRLFETVWGLDPAEGEKDRRTVEVHISRLRKKLGSQIAKRIVSSTGYGYKFTS